MYIGDGEETIGDVTLPIYCLQSRFTFKIRRSESEDTFQESHHWKICDVPWLRSTERERVLETACKGESMRHELPEWKTWLGTACAGDGKEAG